jgi:sugar transferase (PEP-CTERM system associated)
LRLQAGRGLKDVQVLGQQIRHQIALVAMLEAAACFGAPYLAAVIRFHQSITAIESEYGSLWPRGVFFAGAMVIALFCVGQYSPRQRARVRGVLLRIAASAAASFVALAFVYFILPAEYLGRGVLSLTVVIGFLASVAIRSVTSRLVSRDLFKRRVLVYGCGERALTLSRLRRRSDRIGFQIVGFLAAEGEVAAVPPELILRRTDTLLRFCRRRDVHEIVIAMDDRRRGFPVRELLDCKLNTINIIDLERFLERETGRVPLDLIRPSSLILSDGFRRGVFRQVSIRLFDIVASLLMLSFSWPLMLFTMLAIKIEDGLHAPVLYRQTRVGLQGTHFLVLKFRSMRTDAERGGQAIWAERLDRRVTRVGSLVRPLRVDELPQLFNVLAGDMSLVGPRPERPEFVAQLCESIPFYNERHLAKPGITGWAQLCYPYGASERDAVEKLQYDLYYIKNRSLMFDLSILLQTVEVVFWAKGAR